MIREKSPSKIRSRKTYSKTIKVINHLYPKVYCKYDQALPLSHPTRITLQKLGQRVRISMSAIGHGQRSRMTQGAGNERLNVFNPRMPISRDVTSRVLANLITELM